MSRDSRSEEAQEFVDYWSGRGYERGESQPFWIGLLHLLGIPNPEQGVIEFEDKASIDKSHGFIDGYIPGSKVLIEQKGIGKSLDEPIRQSDGSFLTPFQQAKRYIVDLAVSKHPRYVITCNFAQFNVYDMEDPKGEPQVILLKDLPNELYRLQFIVPDSKSEAHLRREMELSVKAGEIVGRLYDAFHGQYKDPDDPRSLRSLNVLCVRLVFLLYAEDSNLLAHHAQFYDYLAHFDTKQMRQALVRLFRVLDTDYEDRDPYLADDDPELAAFPYVNGGLFRDEAVEIPPFTDDMRHMLLDEASSDFDWSGISPTIFGAVFESTLNPETRRKGGMHYTSIENIHKVIDPLFLDDLKAELAEIEEIPNAKKRTEALRGFQHKLAGLTFLDPACGSGNFLTETYVSLRRLENRVLIDLNNGQGQLDLASYGADGEDSIQVKIDHFYGIEINDFAVTVAKTALWIAESQTMAETEGIVHSHLDFLPLTTNASIHEGNALQVDWEEVVPASELDYIMGNPPFIGSSMMTKAQKEEAVAIFGKVRLSNSIDYVGAWYVKAARMMSGTDIRTAFVSTNSVAQGEQVAPLWGLVLNDCGCHIDFAHRTFRWDSEASSKAHVHCVIIGFSFAGNNRPRVIFDGEVELHADNISPYLIDAPNVLVASRGRPVCQVNETTRGSQPTDGGNYILSPQERREVVEAEPELEAYIHPYIGAKDFLHGDRRYCLWLKDASPALLGHSPILRTRLQAIRELREKSSAAPTRAKADTPWLFFSDTQPQSDYIVIPRVSSERRRYVPMGFFGPSVIASDAVQIVPNTTVYDFGILESNVHMSWMRAVAGRLKSDYRYSGGLVYNTFPWPTPSEEQVEKIGATAQGILDARALYPDCSLADLYDPLTMPKELLEAHRANDRAVMAAYGFPVRGFTESDCVAELMKLYQRLANE